MSVYHKFLKLHPAPVVFQLHHKPTSFVSPATHKLIHDVVIVQHIVAIRILRASRPVDHHVAEHLESRVDLL